MGCAVIILTTYCSPTCTQLSLVKHGRKATPSLTVGVRICSVSSCSQCSGNLAASCAHNTYRYIHAKKSNCKPVLLHAPAPRRASAQAALGCAFGSGGPSPIPSVPAHVRGDVQSSVGTECRRWSASAPTGSRLKVPPASCRSPAVAPGDGRWSVPVCGSQRRRHFDTQKGQLTPCCGSILGCWDVLRTSALS